MSLPYGPPSAECELGRLPSVLVGNDQKKPQAGGRSIVAQEIKMSRAEAGRKGGLTTKRRYGDEFFGRIGRIGGKKGGDTTKRRYGVEFYQQIGRKGGSR